MQSGSAKLSIDPWWGAVLLCMVVVLASAGNSPGMMLDTDTIGILRGIDERRNPLSWFVTDWPLQNHFYRPISTLAFELDNWLHPQSAAGFGRTNALLAALTLPGLFWLGRRCLGSSLWAALGLGIFTFWLVRAWVPGLGGWLWMAAVAGPLIMVCVGKWPWRRGFEIAIVGIVAAFMIGPTTIDLPHRMLQWIPGRTASTMAFFAIPALVLAIIGLEKKCWRWGIPALLCAALALGSYEQAVMLPFVLGLLAWLVLPQGELRTRTWLVPGLILLAAYVAIRTTTVSSEISRYQNQQFRFGPGVWLSFADYSFPPVRELPSWIGMFDAGPGILLLGDFYDFPIRMSLGVVTLLILWRADLVRTFISLWGAAFLSMLPMHFLFPFGHYHYLPMMFQALAAAALVQAYAELIRRSNGTLAPRGRAIGDRPT